MSKPTSIWNWSPPRPPWLVIGIVTTSCILILGGLLVTMAITHNTRYEQLGFMLSLVFVLIVLAGMIQTLRRHVVRMRIEIHPDGLRWLNLNRGITRKLTWNDLMRFQTRAIRTHGRVSGSELLIWTRAERTPLVIREEMDDSARHQEFQMFMQCIGAALEQHQVEERS